MNGNLQKNNLKSQATNIYTKNYRLIKTALLIILWISYGCTLEMSRVAIEDLKILLNINYYYMGLLLINMNIGYLASAFIAGLITDKYFKYSSLMIAFSHLFFAIGTFFIPWSKVYWISCALFFTQGMCMAFFDIGSSRSILNVWEGISSSPINALHGAYGIGGILAAQLMRPYLKFNHLVETNSTYYENTTVLIGSDDIQLKAPFTIALIIGALISVAFLGLQDYELNQSKKFKIPKHENAEAMLEQKKSDIKQNLVPFTKLQQILFQNFRYKQKAVYLNVLQIILVCGLFLFVFGFIIMLSYLLTYSTKGPAKLSVDEFLLSCTTFWIFFIIGRISAVFTGYKINTFIFYGLLLISTIFSVVCFSMPFFNTKKLDLLIIVALMGFSSGPLLPSAFMIASIVLKNVSSFMISLFLTSSTMGAIICQYSTGYLLDNFKPDPNWFSDKNATSIYIIPFLMLFYLTISLCIFIMIFIIYKISRNYIKENTIRNDI